MGRVLSRVDCVDRLGGDPASRITASTQAVLALCLMASVLDVSANAMVAAASASCTSTRREVRAASCRQERLSLKDQRAGQQHDDRVDHPSDSCSIVRGSWLIEKSSSVSVNSLIGAL